MAAQLNYARATEVACTKCGAMFLQSASQVKKRDYRCKPCEVARNHIRRPPKRKPSATLDSYVPVPETGCWLWVGRTTKDGYGLLAGGRRGKSLRAHRAMYQATRGPIPAGLFVCHKCDTPSCVNPDHLFLGTPKDNVIDMFRKGRARPQGVPARLSIGAEE